MSELGKYTSAQPYIACFVLLIRDNKVAMVLRKNTSWMNGFYGLPAGKVEWDEPYTLGAIREAKEEAGVDIQAEDLEFAHICHRHSDDSDWVDVYFIAKKWAGEPYNAEEDKSEKMDWIDLSNLPESIVPSQKDAIDRILQKEVFSEHGWE